MKFRKALFLFLIFLVNPISVFASVSITEIMYDPKGTDTGREWIEVLNDGNEVDLSEYKFSEGGTNHSLIISQGNSILGSGVRAIIADNPEKFLIDFPAYSGVIFDSSFSINNTGQTLLLKDKILNILDTAIYTLSMGANNDGNSLQKNSNGVFEGNIPNPGGEDSVPQAELPIQNDPIQTSSQSDSQSTSWPVEPQVFVNAGSDKVAIVGADILFEGKAFGLEKKPLDNARYSWNFGDGMIGEGKSVNHSYKYTGEYIVVLSVSSGFFSGIDKMKVLVEDSKVYISSVGSNDKNFIEITNGSNYEIDISSWMIRVGTSTFTFPIGTFISKNKKVLFPSEITKLNPSSINEVSLLYPNGSLANLHVSKVIENKRDFGVITPSNEKSDFRVINDENKGKIDNDSLRASAVDSRSNRGDNGIYKWLLGVLGVSLISILGVYFIPKKSHNSLSADDFKITEEL